MGYHSNSARERFARRLQQLRKARGLSQEVLAERAGLNRTYVSGVERGTINIRIDNIEKLANTLKAGVDLLFAETPISEIGQATSDASDVRNSLGNNIRAIRKQTQISQEKLAEDAGFHRSYVGNVERGVANLSVDDLQTIASVLKVDVASLFDRTAVHTAQGPA